MFAWILLALLSVVAGQLDLPPLRENSRDNYGSRLPPTEADLENILARLDFLGTERCSANVASQWAYETDVNEYTQLQAVNTDYFKILCTCLKRWGFLRNCSRNTRMGSLWHGRKNLGLENWKEGPQVSYRQSYFHRVYRWYLLFN